MLSKLDANEKKLFFDWVHTYSKIVADFRVISVMSIIDKGVRCLRVDFMVDRNKEEWLYVVKPDTWY